MPTGIYKRTKKHKELMKRNLTHRFQIGHKSFTTEKGRKRQAEALLGNKFATGHKSWLKGKNLPEYIKKKVRNTLQEKHKSGEISFYGENNPNWKNGGEFNPYPASFNKSLKKFIRKRDNYICKNCKITESSHLDRYNKRLHVHHIDYNKYNLDCANLITLCQICNLKANKNREQTKVYYQSIIKKIHATVY